MYFDPARMIPEVFGPKDGPCTVLIVIFSGTFCATRSCRDWGGEVESLQADIQPIG